jgi:hypothetical protein
MFKKMSTVLLSALIFKLGVASALTPKQLEDLTIKAYIYAYPLVLMDVSKKVSAEGFAPINQFANIKAFPTPEFKDVVRPNADTLYSSAWLDLTKEPIILSVPDTQGRYYLMPMLDAWTQVFASPGKRTTGTQSANFAIVGPSFKGRLPAQVKKIQAPTNMVWIIGRTQTNGPSDYDYVHKIQDGFKLTPLSAWGKPYVPPKNSNINPSSDTKVPPVEQVAKMDAVTFFKRFATILKNNPPHPEDRPFIVELRKLGIEPGTSWDVSPRLSAQQIEALNVAVGKAQKQIKARVLNLGVRKNGWSLTPIIGSYGTHYLDRAAVAFVGLGANLPADAIYPTAFVDGDNVPLDGKNAYVIHFKKDQLPPVNAFWSISMYDENSFFIENPIHRYAIGDRDKLQLNEDGSLDIYVQHDSPGTLKESNWLPAPKGPFNLTSRLYWPESTALKGEWIMPPVQKVKQ